MFVPEFLNSGHEISPEGTSYTQVCQHPPSPAKCKTYNFDLHPSESVYEQIVAGIRFKEVPQVNSGHDFVQQYIDPVINVFNKHIRKVEEDSEKPKWKYVYKQDNSPSAGAKIVHIFKKTDAKESLHCDVHLVPSGHICWARILHQPPESYICCASLMDFLRRPAMRTKAPYLLITDLIGIWMIKDINGEGFERAVHSFSHLAKNGSKSLRHALCIILSQAPRNEGYRAWIPYPWVKLCHGALNNPEESELEPGDAPLAAPASPTGIRDFDRYTLQRSIPDLELLENWKEQESMRLTGILVSGMSLAVDVNALERDATTWRCIQYLPPPTPLTSECSASVGRNPRPRSSSAEAILSAQKETNSSLSFQITNVVRHEPDTYSQICFGVLRASDGTTSSEVCLKLFIDALFPVDFDALYEEFDTKSAASRLGSLHCAVDLARQEEAAYHRLYEYQGTLVPHSYGFHGFTLEGSFTAFGALLEIIPGPSLSQLSPATWSEPAQKAFVS
uniref:Fungal-type protein kinase domain-containing protein n=1 Tax=Mycena chlorophos TaxID=658473 RepID=A0ABQ0L448_MYCCL|nr:predicted protein [Mycena chlorophos]